MLQWCETGTAGWPQGPTSFLGASASILPSACEGEKEWGRRNTGTGCFKEMSVEFPLNGA